MTNGPACRGDVPRWEAQCDQPSAGAWSVPARFSPFAPWGATELSFRYASPASSVYIDATSEHIFERFERALLAHRLNPSPLPATEEIRDLIDLKEKRSAGQERAIIGQLDRDELVLPLAARVVRTLKPSLLDLIHWVVTDASRPLFFAKHRFNRVRAYQLFPALTPKFLPDGAFPMHPSFPSGHSTQAHLIVNVLATVFGWERVEAQARDAAWDIGRNREIAGLHYRSDTEGGRHLADVLLSEAESNPKFRTDRDAVRAEYEVEVPPLSGP